MNDRKRESSKGMLGITVFIPLLKKRTFIKTHTTGGRDMQSTGLGALKYNRAAPLHVRPKQDKNVSSL